MSDYIDAAIVTDPETLYQNMVADWQAYYPGWQPATGDLLTNIFRVMSGMGAETRDVSASVPKAIFRQYGDDLESLPPIDAVAATGETTWTFIDTLGHTIKAGFSVSIPGLDGQPVVFNTVADFTVPFGSSSTSSGAVTIQAAVPGSAASGLSGAVSQVTTDATIASIALVGSTADGVDAEDDDTYLGRLSDDLALSTKAPILAPDAAALARNVAGVYRALVIDNYNADTMTSGVAKCCTLVPIDETGAAVSGTIQTAVVTYLTSLRETGFEFFAISPTTTDGSVVFTFVSQDGYEDADVQTRSEAAVVAYLDASAWGLPTTGAQPLWTDTPVVRYLDIARVIGDVDGLAYLVSLSLSGEPAGTDVALAGPGALPGTWTAVGTPA